MNVTATPSVAPKTDRVTPTAEKPQSREASLAQDQVEVAKRPSKLRSAVVGTVTGLGSSFVALVVGSGVMSATGKFAEFGGFVGPVGLLAGGAAGLTGALAGRQTKSALGGILAGAASGAVAGAAVTAPLSKPQLIPAGALVGAIAGGLAGATNHGER